MKIAKRRLQFHSFITDKENTRTEAGEMREKKTSEPSMHVYLVLKMEAKNVNSSSFINKNVSADAENKSKHTTRSRLCKLATASTRKRQQGRKC